MRRVRYRYVAVKIDDGELDQRDAVMAVSRNLIRLFGEYGASVAELTYIGSELNNRILIFRCTHVALEMVRASIASLKEINRRRCSTRIVYVSGTLKALRRRISQSRDELAVQR